MSTVPSAVADPDGRAFPSEDEVAAAKQRAEDKARDVGAIKASLLMANQRLESSAVAAAVASEAYNGAMWRLEEAKLAYRAAKADARRARATVEEQRDSIGRLVAASYQHGTELTALSAMMSADGPEGVLDQYVAFQGASSSLDADYQRFAATDALAQVFESQAEKAREEQAERAEEARTAKDAAQAAAAAAQAAATQIAAQKNRLIRELADAQNISVRLARQRQGALEEIARKRAAQRAQAEAEAAAQAQAAADRASSAKARANAKARAEAKARADAQEQADRPKKRRHQDNNSSDPAPKPKKKKKKPSPPPPPPPPPAPPAPSGGVGAVIGFAMAQLGDPYVWAADGPDSWDCSGLTMRAWAQAGVYLPHYSGAQYDAGTPVSFSNLRRGDLIFWSNNGSSSGIYHVALYIGGGQMIHAPNSTTVVKISDLFYMGTPFGYARV